MNRERCPSCNGQRLYDGSLLHTPGCIWRPGGVAEGVRLASQQVLDEHAERPDVWAPYDWQDSPLFYWAQDDEGSFPFLWWFTQLENLTEIAEKRWPRYVQPPYNTVITHAVARTLRRMAQRVEKGTIGGTGEEARKRLFGLAHKKLLPEQVGEVFTHLRNTDPGGLYDLAELGPLTSEHVAALPGVPHGALGLTLHEHWLWGTLPFKAARRLAYVTRHNRAVYALAQRDVEGKSRAKRGLLWWYRKSSHVLFDGKRGWRTELAEDLGMNRATVTRNTDKVRDALVEHRTTLDQTSEGGVPSALTLLPSEPKSLAPEDVAAFAVLAYPGLSKEALDRISELRKKHEAAVRQVKLVGGLAIVPADTSLSHTKESKAEDLETLRKDAELGPVLQWLADSKARGWKRKTSGG